MNSLHREILWNKFDSLRQYNKSMHEVYSSVKKILDVEITAKKAYTTSFKTQIEMYAKLSSDLKTKPYFMMVSDSINLLKDTLSRKYEKEKLEYENLQTQVYEKYSKTISRHEEVSQKINLGERNLFTILDHRRNTEERFNKFCRTSSEFDLIFEEELIKQQVKTSSAKISLSLNSKMVKLKDKIEEERKAYRFQIETYNRHVPSLFNQNVTCCVNQSDIVDDVVQHFTNMGRNYKDLLEFNLKKHAILFEDEEREEITKVPSVEPLEKREN